MVGARSRRNQIDDEKGTSGQMIEAMYKNCVSRGFGSHHIEI